MTTNSPGSVGPLSAVAESVRRDRWCAAEERLAAAADQIRGRVERAVQAGDLDELRGVLLEHENLLVEARVARGHLTRALAALPARGFGMRVGRPDASIEVVG